MRNVSRIHLILMMCAVFSLGRGPSAQEARVGGPPPEIRALVSAFLEGVNANADGWEAMAKARFSSGFLEKQPVEERRKLHERIRAAFGTVAFERATREGPEAPLALQVKGSTGASGSLSIEIEGTGDAVRIGNVTMSVAGKGEAPSASGPPRPAIRPSMSPDELGAALDAYLSSLAKDDVFSGVALVAKDDVPVFQNAYGMADRARKIPNTVRTRFNIGSINKTFTQLAVAQLVAQGQLAVSDTLGTLVPDYPQDASRSATVAQLLDHTAGLPDFFGPEFAQAAKDRFRSNADYFRFVSARAPLFAPGARRQYCNGCYIALGAIIERVSGVPYERYVADHIFRPADMASTGYVQSDAIEPDVAIGYTRRGSDAVLRSNFHLHGAAGSAAGGGYATAGDLLAYVKARRDGRLAPKDPGRLGIAGGAPGISAVVESNGVWTVVVLSNLDPPTGERIGTAIMEALGR